MVTGDKPGPAGHVEKRGDSWRVVIEAGMDVATGRRKRIVRSGIASRQEAQRLLRKLLSDLEEQTFVTPSRLTVDAYLDHWLEGHSMVASSNTLEIYRVQVRAYVGPHIGSKPMQLLTPSGLDDLYSTLLRRGRRDGKGLALKTVRNVHVMLHRALQDAVANDLIRRNPAARAKPPSSRRAKNPPTERPTWNRSQAESFLGYVRQDRLRALYLLALTTGLRRSEALGLTWEYVDFTGGSLAVVQVVVEVNHQPTFKPIPKTDRSRRRLALDDTTIAALKEHRRNQLEERLLHGDAYMNLELVFSREDGFPLGPSWLSRKLVHLAKAAGVPDLSPRPFHGLRHTYGTLALEAGVPIEVISKRLGHASIATTADIYQHLRPGTDRDAAERVAGFIFNSG